MKMFYKKIIFSLALFGGIATGCSDDDYVDANVNPDVLTEVPPENQFLSATLSLHSQDFEAFYDFYTKIMPWMQYITPVNGNAPGFTSNAGNFSNRYGRLYTGVGDALVDMEQLVAKLPVEEQAKYVHMLSIARILKAYYAFYVSDIYGSIPYTEAWQARYGGTMTPVYDDQQSLFTKLDGEIKQAIATLKIEQNAPQISLDNFDQYYGGNLTSWIKAGNALRLKIATRFIKRDQAKAAAIAQEVLAEGTGALMQSNSEGWVFKATSGFTSGGNWNPDALYASKPLVDFMWDNDDPRLDAIVSPNGYSQSTINILIAQGKLKAGTTEASRRYLGSFTSPDESDAAENLKYYQFRTAKIGDSNIRVDTISLIQRRLFQPAFSEGGSAGTGLVNIPVITYAEFCFMRAEFAARNITTEDAEAFYYAGITASIEWYDEIAQEAKVSNYTPLTSNEISDYLDQPDVAYDDSKALELISVQAYLHYFKQASEGWAVWKRNGFPNTSSVLALSELRTNGSVLAVPRRAPLQLLSQVSLNYVNQKAAYDAMAQDSGFGAGPNDIFGRVWWDN